MLGELKYRPLQPGKRSIASSFLVSMNAIAVSLQRLYPERCMRRSVKIKYPMKFGVVVFPGSNCDHDAWFAASHNLGQQAEFIWHDATHVGDVDAVILPGGFSYGDYLRCGAIAKFSPVMGSVRKFAADGGLGLAICNGF